MAKIYLYKGRKCTVSQVHDGENIWVDFLDCNESAIVNPTLLQEAEIENSQNITSNPIATELQANCNPSATPLQPNCNGIASENGNNATPLQAYCNVKNESECLKTNKEAVKWLLNSQNISIATNGVYKSVFEIPFNVPKSIAGALKDANKLSPNGKPYTIEALRPVIFSIKLKDRIKKPVAFFWCFCTGLVSAAGAFLYSNSDIDKLLNINDLSINREVISEDYDLEKLIDSVSLSKRKTCYPFRRNLIKKDVSAQNASTKTEIVKIIENRLNEI